METETFTLESTIYCHVLCCNSSTFGQEGYIDVTTSKIHQLKQTANHHCTFPSFFFFTLILWLPKYWLYWGGFFFSFAGCTIIFSAKLFLWTALLIYASHKHICDTRKAGSELGSENRADGQAAFWLLCDLVFVLKKKFKKHSETTCSAGIDWIVWSIITTSNQLFGINKDTVCFLG